MTLEPGRDKLIDSTSFDHPGATLLLFGLGLADQLNLQTRLPASMSRPYRHLLRQAMSRGHQTVPSLVPGAAPLPVPSLRERSLLNLKQTASTALLWGLNGAFAFCFQKTIADEYAPLGCTGCICPPLIG